MVEDLCGVMVEDLCGVMVEMFCGDGCGVVVMGVVWW